MSKRERMIMDSNKEGDRRKGRKRKKKQRRETRNRKTIMKRGREVNGKNSQKVKSERLIKGEE